MPFVWTHIIFGEELLQKSGLSSIIEDPRLKQIFNLGCQGPDVLFYHNYLPWRNSRFATELGNMMHAKECGPFILQLINEVKNRSIKDPALIYTIGFITHHILDRTMHPFVFYHSGFTPLMHQRFEIIMDTLIVKAKLGIDTWRTPTWKLLAYEKSLLKEIPVIMHKIAKQLYPEHSKHVQLQEWRDSYRQMIQAQKIFHDPHGIKMKLTFGLLEPYVYKRTNAPLDYLNEQHAEWNCPTSLAEKHTDSIWDLWDKARLEGVEILIELSRILKTIQQNKSANFNRLIELLGNISYDSGKPCDSSLEIIHVKSMIG
ncbi:zinc dependent phospholipase C family protein [Paenibacillus albiflavus]|nr:zinc dependent phospholipase C family protein [Paenibacillus albiflavus]